jgi:Ca-activated chloride channel homolog
MAVVSRTIRHPLLLAVALFALVTFSQAFPQTEQGIRIDLSADAQVKIENPFGGISTEVWNERFILVSAEIAGHQSFRRSPVVIENRNGQMLITVIRTPVDPQVDVSLNVKLPQTVRAEVITRSGNIALRGLPATASLRSGSGNIRAELSGTADLDLTARSSKPINSDLDRPLAEDGRALTARYGSGSRVLRLQSDTGQINIFNRSNELSAASEPSGPPVLRTPDNSPMVAAGTPANNSPTEEVEEGDVIRVDSQLVTLNVSVIDRQTNKGVLGLTQDDFRLYEDGVEQSILRFDSASAPFDLILLIDLSGSTREVVKLIREAALRFVVAARPADRIGIVTFAGQPALVSAVTLDRERLRSSIARIDTAAGDTKLYDATDFALRRFNDPKNGRRTAVVLMSDGLDGTVPGVSRQQGSKLSYSDLLNVIQEYDGVLYTLWLNTYYEALHPQDTTAEAFDTGHDRMRELAEAGGGAFYEVERLEDLAGAYERVVADLGTVYSLAYRPANKTRDGKWRAIRVNLNRSAAVARGKHGYYAN